MPRNEQQKIFEQAISAFGHSTGLKFKVLVRRASQGHLVELKTGKETYSFSALVKTVDGFATPAALKTGREQTLLIAPYISRNVAEKCRQLGVPFLDAAGNAYLNAPGLFVYIAGLPRTVDFRKDNFRALKPAGLKVTFALLCRPALLQQSYRNIATASGVALGSVSADMKDLSARRYFTTGTDSRRRKLLHPNRMLEEWVTHYPITLRPKLSLGRFSADPEWLRQLKLPDGDAYWSGQVGADRLTQYLKPAHFTIYTSGSIAKLVAAGRMRADADGNVDILEKFWNFPADTTKQREMPDVVPPILVYADLMATGNARCAEAARIVYEQRIAPAFHTAA